MYFYVHCDFTYMYLTRYPRTLLPVFATTLRIRMDFGLVFSKLHSISEQTSHGLPRNNGCPSVTLHP